MYLMEPQWHEPWKGRRAGVESLILRGEGLLAGVERSCEGLFIGSEDKLLSCKESD